jgi:hypothetical protein
MMLILQVGLIYRVRNSDGLRWHDNIPSLMKKSVCLSSTKVQPHKFQRLQCW